MRARPVAGRPTLAALVALVLMGAPGAAAAQQPTLRTTVDTARITMGDRIQMSLSVEHAPGLRVVWPDSLDLAPFEVLAAQADPPTAQPDAVMSRAVLTLTSFELGELEIPSFDVTVEGPDGADTLRTDPFGIEVVSVGLDEGDGIRGIRGPMAIPVSLVRVGLALLLALLALVAGGWLWRRRRGRGEGAEAAPAAPPRPAHEVALDALDALERSGLLVEGRVKDFHVALSEIARRYVEARFQVPALEMTTREIGIGLAASSAPTEFTHGLGPVLDRCDLVKFAKVRPPPDSARVLLDDVRALVRRTIPRAEPVEVAEPAEVAEVAETAEPPEESP